MTDENIIQNYYSDAESSEEVVNTNLFNRMFAWKKISAQNDNSTAKLNAKIDELENSCSKIHEKLSVEVEGNKQQVQKYNELKDDYVKTTSRLTDIEKQLAVEKEKNSTLSIKISDLYDKIKEDEQRNADISRKLDEEQKKYQNELIHSADLTNEVSNKVSEISDLTTQITLLEQKNEDISLKLDEEQKKYQNELDNSANLTQEISNKVSEISDLTVQISSLQNEIAENKAQIVDSWQNHVSNVANMLESYASKYNFIKINTEDYQYAGSPQNVFQFAKQYTIIDAINPESLDDLKDFQNKVKEYAEEMKKYYKTDLLRTDAYLVVPTSAMHDLETINYYFPEYEIHVITPEAMLPILQMLSTLETYDFANQVSAEGRDKICKLLARLSLTAKKKVQADTIYSKDLISTLKDIKTLPTQYTNAITNYEEQTKLLEIESLSSNVDKIEKDYIDYALEGTDEKN